MSDVLLENPWARKAITSLGLPLPVPERLLRASSAWEERPLADEPVAFGAAPGSALVAVVARTLTAAGANPFVLGDTAAFKAPGEAYGRPAKPLALDPVPADLRPRGVVFDASAIESPEGLRALYDFFHPLVPALARSGRLVVLGRARGSTSSPEAAAAQQALEGFIKSMGRELGKRGSTANLLLVEKGAEERLEAPLRWLLSRRSAFVTGQVLEVGLTAKGTATPAWTRPLEGKVALVTGAARGIGAATAQLLADEGAHVVCLDRPADDEAVSQVARKLKGSVLLADVSDDGAAAAIAKALKEKHGGVDIVVHNAGITRDKTLARMSSELWDQTLNINLRAITRITAALEKGVLRDGGRVICLSSIAGIAGNMGQSNYAASKAGVIGYVQALAPALGKRGITVNAIAPGFIETRLTDAIPMMVREVARRLSNLGQGGLPRDVGDAITFLASPGALGVTGRVLRVCGGSYVGA
ncbi:MAG: 3-oxoacyl-ACP reductase [Myxococcaceae bacterium]|nr:3-oxoacyl-ACP reductase [Myxococcaceae bacterium]